MKRKFFILSGKTPEIVEERPDVPYYTIKTWNIEEAKHVVKENIKRNPDYYL